MKKREDGIHIENSEVLPPIIRRWIAAIVHLCNTTNSELDDREQYQLRIYVVGLSIGIPVCLAFMLYHLIVHQYMLGIIDLLTSMFLLVNLRIVLIIPRRIIMYRLTVYGMIIMLLYVASVGFGNEGTLLWMFMAPPMCFFWLRGHDALISIGFASTGIGLIFSGVPLFLSSPYMYPRSIQIRFWVTYGLLCLFCYLYERNRMMFQEQYLQERQKLQEEIQERLRVERQLTHSLQEKETLLKEIHHRVKNNLQVISSLLNLQTAGVDDEQILTMFRESRQRVRSMALIHEKLYQSESLSQIDMHEYITALIRELSLSYSLSSGAVDLRVDVDNVHFGLDMAITCGLLINELVSNAFKYAFQEDQGRISIELTSLDGNGHSLVISDTGCGLPDDFDMNTLDSLGLQLVKGLVEEQLGGTLTLHSIPGTGTTWQISF